MTSGGSPTETSLGIRRRVATLVGLAFSKAGFELIRKRPYRADLREIGGDWPPRSVSMIGLKRMDNIRYCVETALEDDVELTPSDRTLSWFE